MGRNRKWVLEDNLSQAMWRTILRGPHPPPGAWQRGSKPSSMIAPTRNPGGHHGRTPPRQPTGPRAPQGRANPTAPQPRLSPDERAAEARARVERLEAALKVLGEDSPEAQPLKEALKKAQDQCRVLLVGERLDSTLKFIQRSQARIKKMEAELGREKTLLQQALVSRERLGDEAANSVSEPPAHSRPPQAQMDVEDSEEEIRRLRAQVAELQQERVGGTKRRRVVPRRLGFCPHQRWIWPHCILEQQDHAARQI